MEQAMFPKAFSLGHTPIWGVVELVDTHFVHDGEIISTFAFLRRRKIGEL